MAMALANYATAQAADPFAFERAQTEAERYAWYYHTVLTEAPTAKELRLFGLGALFHSRYRDLRQSIRGGRPTCRA
jgi:hypothetical protein